MTPVKNARSNKRKEKKYAELGVVYTCLIPNNMTAMTIDVKGNVPLRVSVGGSGPCGLCKSILPVVQTVVEQVVKVVTEYGSCQAEAPAKGLGLGCEVVTCVPQVVGSEANLTKDAIFTLYNGRCLLKWRCAQLQTTN